MYDPEEIEKTVKEKQEKNKKIAVKLIIFDILLYVTIFSIQAITSRNIRINYTLILVLLGFSIVITKLSKLINEIDKKIENYARIKLLEALLLSLVVSFSVYYMLSKNIIMLYILLAFLIISAIITSRMINVFYKALISGTISLGTDFNKNIKSSTLVDIGGIILILFTADIIILLISEMSRFLNLFSISIITIFSAIIVLLAIYIYKSYNYKLFKIN
jgi:hypothetical protein